MLWVEWLQGFPEIELDSFSDYFRDDIHIEDAYRMLRSSSHIRRSDMRNNNLWTQYCVNGTVVIYLYIYILLKKALHHLDIQYLNTSIHFLGLFWHRLGYFVWKRHIHSVWLLHWVWNSGKLTEFSETVSYWISRSCYMIYFVFFSWYLLLRQLLYSWKPRRKTELQQKGKKENIEGWQITQLWSPYQKNQAYLITRLKTISQINRTPMSICNIQTEINENSFFAFVSQYM